MSSAEVGNWNISFQEVVGSEKQGDLSLIGSAQGATKEGLHWRVGHEYGKR